MGVGRAHYFTVDCTSNQRVTAACILIAVSTCIASTHISPSSTVRAAIIWATLFVVYASKDYLPGIFDIGESFPGVKMMYFGGKSRSPNEEIIGLFGNNVFYAGRKSQYSIRK